MDVSKHFDQLRTPGYRRSVAIRRAVAIALVAVAAAQLLLGAAREDPAVLVFAREVAPGVALTTDDVELRRLPHTAVPEGALRDAALVDGQLLAAAAAPGEVVTTTRLVGPDLAAALVADEPEGEPFSMVPVPVAEADVIPLLTHGARVDVVGQGPRTVATGGRVVTASEKGTVLVLLRQSDAEQVAASSLSEPLTLVLSARTHAFNIP